MVGVVQKETDLVRAGHLGKATGFEQPKAELARLYIADTLRLRASHRHLSRIVPAAKLEALRLRHDAFRALLQINLTVLATAHAVSEGIVRGVSAEMAQKSALQTYGASGRPTCRAVAPPRRSRSAGCSDPDRNASAAHNGKRRGRGPAVPSWPKPRPD